MTRDEGRSGWSSSSALQDPDRLGRLRSTGLLDTPAEADFDRWTSFVRRTLEADISLITLIDRDRQFFKSTAGLGEPWATRRETALSHSFAKHVVARGETVRVTDARQDSELAHNPAVEELGVVAYLGVPLRAPEGRILGAISAIQHEPREWSELDVQNLEDVAAAVEAEIRLRALENRTVAVLANISDMISIVDGDGRTLYRSPSIQAILGHDLTDETGVRMELVHPEDREKVEQAAEDVRSGLTGGSTAITVRIRDADGRYRTLESRVTNFFDEPAIGGYLWVARDVTDRTSVEERLSLLLGHAPVALWTVDRELRFTWTGGSALHEMGLSEEALLGRSVYEVLGTDDPTAPPIMAYRRALTGESERFDTEWGGRTWGVQVSPLSEAGQVVGVVGVAVDVTHHREVERRLEERTAHFEQLFKEAPEAIVVLDRQNRVLEANPEFERLFGYVAREAAGQLLDELIAVPGQEREGTEIMRRVIEGERVELEAIRRHKDGTSVEVSILATPVDVGDERQIYVIFRDITDRKELEAQLLHSQRLEAVGQLAGGIAHDFNNILTAILGHAQVLLAQHRSEPDLREDLQEIQDAGQRAARLTRQLLTFSRKDIASPRPLDVTEIVRSMRAMLERLIEERIRLSFVLENGLPLVELDPGQLEQIVMNLVINARDAMPRGGRLVVSTSRCTPDDTGRHDVPDGFDGVIIEVADEGTGMTAEERTRLFEPFFTTKTPGEGTGLGLSTVYGIVERAGGFIRVDTAPGRGTRMKVYIPALTQPDEPHEALDHGVTGDVPESQGELILLVDDDRPVRNVTRRILEYAGYRVVEAESGEHAIELCDGQGLVPAAVVSDLVMPGISGYELVRELEARRPGIAVLLMTGYTEPGTGDPSRERELLHKPFEPMTLIRRLRELLARSSD